MNGVVCLQGGAELGPGCRGMDAELLRLADGPVVVAPLAAPVGEPYRTTGDHAASYFTGLGAADVTVAPDVRESGPEALYVLRSARLLVLPGGSPARLLAALTGTAAGDAVADVLADGGVVSGASAGAMVLCPWTVVPDAPGGPVVVAGLGLVPGVVVVPHWTPDDSRADWLQALRDAVPEDVQVLGLPEQSGVVLSNGSLVAVGSAPTRLLTSGRDLPPGERLRTSGGTA